MEARFAASLSCPACEPLPVILDLASEALWLDPGANVASLHALLVPYPGERREAMPVSLWVNDPKHEGGRCLESVGA